MPISPSGELRRPFALNAPGNAFLDTLIGADLDGDGIEVDELDRAYDALVRLSRDGKDRDVDEQALLAELRQARKSHATIPVEYEVKDEEIVLKLAGKAKTIKNAPDRPPLPVLEIGTAKLIDGDDPGDFYCEHMFFSAQLAASKPGSSVLSNSKNEKMVGFLHLPSDPWTASADPVASQADRHANTRKIVGAALRGWIDQGARKVLLTGYDTFSWVQNNPTGDFVTHRENIDAAMAAAYGSLLLTKEGTKIERGAYDTFRYQIKDPINGKKRDIEISTIRFPVSDEAIDPAGGKSIWKAIDTLKPHAVLSMGVTGADVYKAEHRADAGGLSRSILEAHHLEGATDHTRLANNYALARAIQAGLKVT